MVRTRAELAGLRPDPATWTAIVPAAGRGTRLGANVPKLLFPVAGRPILAWLADVLGPRCARVVWVVSPDAADAVAAAGPPPRSRLAVQAAPTGMADAVAIGLDHADTPHVLVVWGDQVLLRGETLDATMGLHAARPGARLTLATILRDDPYVNVVRDPQDRIVRIQQRREGEIAVAVGENDCGLFCFDRAALAAVLAADTDATGHHTGERNLLQLLPRFEAGPGSVATVRISDPDETLGVNTPAEAAAAAAILAARSAP